MTKSELEQEIPMIPPYRVVSMVSILAETKDYNHEMMNVPAMWKQIMGAADEKPELFNLTLKPTAEDFEMGTVKIPKENVIPIPGQA